MNSIALAFTIMAIITGFSLFCVAIDTFSYRSMPFNRWKWLVGLLVSTVVFTFVAVLTNGKGCEDYTVSEYKYGNVPISCTKDTPE